MPNEAAYNENLHKGATPLIFRNAIDLRQRETEAEEKLWQLLRNRKLKGRKFRRQHAIDKFILDFYCHECKLAVELDGGIHDLKENKEYDEARTTTLNEHSIKVLRFRNEELINDPEKVLAAIGQYL